MRDEAAFVEFAEAAPRAAAPYGVPAVRRLGPGVRLRPGGAHPRLRRVAAAGRAAAASYAYARKAVVSAFLDHAPAPVEHRGAGRAGTATCRPGEDVAEAVAVRAALMAGPRPAAPAAAGVRGAALLRGPQRRRDRGRASGAARAR